MPSWTRYNHPPRTTQIYLRIEVRCKTAWVNDRRETGQFQYPLCKSAAFSYLSLLYLHCHCVVKRGIFNITVYSDSLQLSSLQLSSLQLSSLQLSSLQCVFCGRCQLAFLPSWIPLHAYAHSYPVSER